MPRTYDTDNTRQWSGRYGRSESGRSTIFVTCPFCGTETLAYIWSMAGHGKRCSGCPALHVWWGWSALPKQTTGEGL